MIPKIDFVSGARGAGSVERDNRSIADPAPPDPARPDTARPDEPRADAPTRNPARAIYGLIAIASLLAAESDQHDSLLDAFASAAIATALYWMAHAYSELLAGRLAARERLSAAALGRALARDWTIVLGAALPLAAIAIAWATGASRQTGVAAAMWSAIALLVGFELFAGIRARASARELALDAGVGAAMGVGVLALKIVLH